MTFFVAGATLVGTGIGAISASKAAKKQAKAAKEAISAEERMFERNVQLQEPWRQSGISAQNQLMTLLGLTPPSAPTSALAPQPAPSTAIGGGLGGIDVNQLSKKEKGVIAKLISRLNQSAASPAGSLGRIYTQLPSRGESTATAPGQPVGSELQVNTASPDFGRYAKEFGMDQFQADPGYAFRMAEGMKALERSAAARGGLISGAAMKGIQRFGQDLASQEYTNAFNRYQAERTARLNPLLSLAGAGQMTAQQLGQAGMQLGQSTGENLMSGANARASGYMGVANALNQGLGSYLNYSQNQNLLKLLRPTTPTTPD